MTTTRNRPVIYPLAGTVVVAGLAALNWILDPADIMRWAIAGLVVPLGWCLFEVLLRNRAALRDIRGSVVLASTLLAVTLGFRAADAAGLLGAGGDDVTRRAFGVAIGLVLVVIGNAIPKKLEPMLAKSCSPAQLQSMQRFAGWTFVLAGLGYAAASAFVPLAYANTTATTICAGAVILVLARWMLISAGRNAH